MDSPKGVPELPVLDIHKLMKEHGRKLFTESDVNDGGEKQDEAWLRIFGQRRDYKEALAAQDGGDTFWYIYPRGRVSQVGPPYGGWTEIWQVDEDAANELLKANGYVVPAYTPNQSDLEQCVRAMLVEFEPKLAKANNLDSSLRGLSLVASHKYKELENKNRVLMTMLRKMNEQLVAVLKQ